MTWRDTYFFYSSGLGGCVEPSRSRNMVQPGRLQLVDELIHLVLFVDATKCLQSKEAADIVVQVGADLVSTGSLLSTDISRRRHFVGRLKSVEHGICISVHDEADSKVVLQLAPSERGNQLVQGVCQLGDREYGAGRAGQVLGIDKIRYVGRPVNELASRCEATDAAADGDIGI